MSEVKLDIERLREELSKQIDKCSYIINGLKDYEPYLKMVEDFKAYASQLDASWQFIDEEKPLRQAQITKMATMSVINAINNYQHDLEKAQEGLLKIDNPDKVTDKDYDGE